MKDFGWMLFSSYYDDYEGYANPGSNGRLDPGIMATTSTSTKSIISRSSMMRVGHSKHFPSLLY